jgi:hypothetical protein
MTNEQSQKKSKNKGSALKEKVVSFQKIFDTVYGSNSIIEELSALY